MRSPIERYRQLAAMCSATDYSSPGFVARHNAAADEMRRLAAAPGAVEVLTPLLDEPEPGRWLAFQLMELGRPPAPVAERCLAMIRRLSAGSDGEAMGARMWLKEHAGRLA